MEQQPQNSAGCIFQNISETTQKRLGLPSTSWGYIIDKVLRLKGRQIGGAAISKQHAAFIVNKNGRAKARDILGLIALIKSKSKHKIGIVPKLEIRLLGFGNKDE